MAIPSITDLTRYINRKLTGLNWNNNLQKIVNWLTDGTADVSFNTIDIASDLAVGGDLDVTGDVTANKFYGDGSALSNLNQWRKNFIINGGCLIKTNADYTLVDGVYGESVDRFYGLASGTAVSAGTFTQTTSANCGTTGYAIKFSGVTLTGVGELYLRHKFYSKNAVNFKNKIASFSCQVYHDAGVSVPYTIYINKGEDPDDFGGVVEIANSGGIGIDSEVETQLKLENVSMGDCSNCFEILIKVECGAITLKNFEFAELQLEIGSTASEFEYRPKNNDLAMNRFDETTNEFKNIYSIKTNIPAGNYDLDISTYTGKTIRIYGSGVNILSPLGAASFFKFNSSGSSIVNFCGFYYDKTTGVTHFNSTSLASVNFGLGVFVMEFSSTNRTHCHVRFTSPTATNNYRVTQGICDISGTDITTINFTNVDAMRVEVNE